MLSLAVLITAVTISKIEISEDGKLLTDAEQATFLNAARCACGSSFQLSFDVYGAGDQGSLEVLSGKRCIDSEGRISSSCTSVWNGKLDGLEEVSLDLEVDDLTGCGDEETLGIVVVIDPEDEDQWQEVGKLELPVDTDPPPEPVNAKANPGEGLVEVLFERPKGEEKISYQVLCERAGAPVFEDPPAAAFTSAYDLCGTGSSTVSEHFVCGEASSGTDSVTVLELVDGQRYRFYVVTVDAFGNPSAVASAGMATPAPEQDLWELYQKNGGKADGGHCFVATAAYGDYDHPQVRSLRRFRDRVLAESELGREAIDFYYRHSPPLAAWIARSDARRTFARMLLWPLALAAGGVTP
jgi:hypothetical protein